jgi:hypothetical protein
MMMFLKFYDIWSNSGIQVELKCPISMVMGKVEVGFQVKKLYSDPQFCMFSFLTSPSQEDSNP